MLPLRGKWSESRTWHRPYSAVYLHRHPTLLVREINNPRSFIGGLQNRQSPRVPPPTRCDTVRPANPPNREGGTADPLT